MLFSFGLRSILVENGFRIIEQRKTINDKGDFSIGKCLLDKMTVTRTLCKYSIDILFDGPWNILGTLVGRILPKNNDLFLDNVVVAQKDDAHE